ncbi:MAG: FecR domain-containing protein [Spirochaetales bacterium]|nr:FecR domain-containing protein [Spirochaetales bacterium]
MKNKKTVLFILSILFISTLGYAEDGIIAYFDGDVTVQREGSTFDAEFGLSVFQGDILKTGNNALLILELNNKSELKLRENTILVLESTGKETSLILNIGSVFSRVNKMVNGSFSIRTPSMVAGVRGTEFFVAYGRTIDSEPDIWLCVNEGSVNVSLTKSGDSVIVNEGEGINIISGNKLTEPIFYPWTKDLNWNTDPDKGIVKDITNLDSAYSDLLDQDYE